MFNILCDSHLSQQFNTRSRSLKQVIIEKVSDERTFMFIPRTLPSENIDDSSVSFQPFRSLRIRLYCSLADKTISRL